MQVLREKPLPARRVGVPRIWKGFGHEKSSTSASDRCHHRYHCLDDIITSSGVARRLGYRSHERTNRRYGGRWNSGRRPGPWPRLLLLSRTGRLQSGCILLRPLVLYGVSLPTVIARCDAEIRAKKDAERSAAFCADEGCLDATKVMRRSKRKRHRIACAARRIARMCGYPAFMLNLSAGISKRNQRRNAGVQPAPDAEEKLSGGVLMRLRPNT